MPYVYTDLPGAGTQLALQTAVGPPAVFTEIPGATDLSWDGFKRGVRNPTLLTSPAIVKKPGMTDFGQCKCTVYYNPNDPTHQAIVARLTATAAAASAAIDTWRVTYADGMATPSSATFTGFVSDFSHKSGDPETGTLSADMTIEVINVTAFTPGTP